ncbi:prolyl-tRNA synthetase [Paenibacillus sp. DS2015]|uniref:proline--tRNA ligase n=1 Tax=Paenibacillus sp. DS2015 TaxID=3373917 RepID=UPI003D240DD5
MRQNTLLMPTLRDTPSDTEAISHQLLLRVGLIRQLAAGVYSYLPMGWRVLRKIENIVRQEMERTGAQELHLPVMQPTELWHESGRYADYGPELIRLDDRHGREFALGPTHEEVITSLVANDVKSYRKLPVNLFQIQTKFRDERRPRYGLLRGREFLMKDAYSFDIDWAGLDVTYKAMFEAYHQIFSRCGLRFTAVEADAGTIGGEGETHEFMALADVGEDTVVTCSSCQYSANLEKAISGSGPASDELTPGERSASVEKLHTPHTKTVAELVTLLGVQAKDIFKTLIYVADGDPIAVVMRGDHNVNETKLLNELAVTTLELADDVTVMRVSGTPHGYVGPVGLTIPIYMDDEVAKRVRGGIVGANEENYHLRYVVPGVHFSAYRQGDYREVQAGDVCLHCGAPLQFDRGIEVGHVFKLGTKYSEKLGAKYLDVQGKEQPMIMGCYGIGISRLLAAVIEQNNDDHGIVWPKQLAPFQVHIIPVSVKDSAQVAIAEQLYKQMLTAGIEVLLDDRDERAGVKFKDSDLLGIPMRIVVGKDAVNGIVEFKERHDEERLTLDQETVLAKVLALAQR